MDINEIHTEWSNWVDMKNPYQFGNPMDMKDFQSLLKATYKWARKIKYDILNNQSNTTDILNYVTVVSLMSRYIPDTCTRDESEEELFTATCLLASGLVDFCTNNVVQTNDLPEIVCWTEQRGDLIYNFDKEDYTDFLNYNVDDY